MFPAFRSDTLCVPGWRVPFGKRAMVLLLLFCCLAQTVVANTLSGMPATHAHPLLTRSTLSGEATLRFFGMQIYTARLWRQPEFQAENFASYPLVLELEYRRKLKGRAIAERSIKEMRRAGAFNDEQASVWLAQMSEIFPDISAGDRLTGLLLPGEGVEFIQNNHSLGKIYDARFAQLFFSIWLAPTTSEPDMRDLLLGRGGVP
jgi:hypothetical protein